LARELATEAVSIAVWCGDPASDISPTSLVAPPTESSTARERTYHQLLHGLDHVVAGNYSKAAELLRGAFETHAGLPEDYDLLPGLSIGAMHLGDFGRAETHMHRLLNRARTDGGIVMVLYALTRLTMIDLVAGRWSDAVSDASEAVSLGETTGQTVLADTPAAFLLLLAALRGEDATFDALAPRLEAAVGQGVAGVLGVVLRDVVHWAHGIRQTGRPATAFHHFGQMSHDLSKRMAGLDRIEAAVRSDQTEAAQLWVEDFRAFSAATGHAWAEAIAEHGQGLLAQPDAAERHYLAALDLHQAAMAEQAGRPFDLARTQLAYGEFLRRARRRVDARTQLRAAHDVFEGLRARAWMERAATELRASGETVRRRGDTDDQLRLTPQERQVAQLVQKGMSNKDIAAQLFVSPRTVDFHLRNVFSKSGVSSRAELFTLVLD
jgi:DNA-binding CsgD family transcriptional regulator